MIFVKTEIIINKLGNEMEVRSLVLSKKWLGNNKEVLNEIHRIEHKSGWMLKLTTKLKKTDQRYTDRY